MIEGLEKLQQNLVVVSGDDELSKAAQHNATLNFFILLRSMLSSKRVLQEYRLSPESFEWLMGEIETRFLVHRVNAGDQQSCTG